MHNASGHDDHNCLEECQIQQILCLGGRNLRLLAAMIITFTWFWYPVFVLTLIDIHYTVQVSVIV